MAPKAYDTKFKVVIWLILMHNLDFVFEFQFLRLSRDFQMLHMQK